MRNFVFAAAICALPFVGFNAPAFAASAHNVQKGTSTTNTNDVPGTQAMM